MIELWPEPPPPEGPDPALAGNIGDTNSGSYPVMCSSTFWMKVPEDEEETAAAAEDEACGAAVAQRIVVGSLPAAEVESLGASRDRLVGEMGPLRLRPCPVPAPPGYVKSWKQRCRLGKWFVGSGLQTSGLAGSHTTHRKK